MKSGNIFGRRIFPLTRDKAEDFFRLMGRCIRNHEESVRLLKELRHAVGVEASKTCGLLLARRGEPCPVCGAFSKRDRLKRRMEDGGLCAECGVVTFERT